MSGNLSRMSNPCWSKNTNHLTHTLADDLYAVYIFKILENLHLK